MSAAAIQIATNVFIPQDDGWEIQGVPYTNISYTQLLNDNGVVVVSATGSHPPEIIRGFLYVPQLDSDDPCIALNAPYVPANTTTTSDIPSAYNQANDNKLIALAPWLGQDDCQAHYLAAAVADKAGVLVFFPANNSTKPPAPSESDFWRLNGNTAAWKDHAALPIFAISGAAGNKLIAASAEYSGNITQLPHAAELLTHYKDTDSLRLFVEIDIADSGGISPELWIFLLLVLGAMLLLMGVTSLLMHWVQIRRKRDLRRRVENGEVDLEVLGIKRLTVPQEVLDKMPVYTYGSGEPARVATPGSEAERAKASDPVPPPPGGPVLKNWLTSHSGANNAARRPNRSTSFAQPVCAICLEDFVPASPQSSTPGTTVRELPCRHIFHPECVDTFLRDTSSLCPLCKSSALPTGYCPKTITNAMVRRERILRRRGALPATETGEQTPTQRSRMLGWGRGMLNRAERNATSESIAIPLRIRATRSQTLTQTDTEAAAATATAPAAPIHTEAGVGVPPPAPRSTPPISPIAEEDAPAAPAEPAPGPPSPPETPAEPTTAAAQSSTPAVVQPSSNPGRREWARQRAVAMLGPTAAPLDPDAEEARTMSGWRKAVLKVWPAVGR